MDRMTKWGYFILYIKKNLTKDIKKIYIKKKISNIDY